MAQAQLSLLVVAATLLLTTVTVQSTDLMSYTLDTSGHVGANGVAVATYQTGVVQNANLPALMSSDISTYMVDMSAYYRRTKETYVKFYVKCTGSYIGTGTGSTYTLTYELDGGTAVTLGSTYTSTSNPFVYVEGLDDGAHTLTVTCSENALSYTTALPASATTETSPLVFTWVVDTTTTATVAFTSDAPDYVNSYTTSLSLSGSIALSSYISSFAWLCSMEKTGDTPVYETCGCGSAQTCATTANQNKDPDGEYSFKTQLTVTYLTSCASTAAPKYCTDLANKVVVKGTSWILDTEDPELVVTSSPPQKAVYYDGKQVRFEFACKSSEATSCSYMCRVDGKDSADGRDSSRSDGAFSCTSPLKVSVANTTTHSLTVKAFDKAGNDSPWTDLYMFYADGTPPTVKFTMVDDSVSFTSQQLASGSTYYSAKNDYEISSGARLFLTTGSYAALDEQNHNTADASYLAGSATSVIQYTSGSSTATTAAVGETAKSTYHTVLQVPYDPTKMPFELDGTYGAILAMKNVNGMYYYNVLDTTNANFGTINFQCTHPEMLGPSL